MSYDNDDARDQDPMNGRRWAVRIVLFLILAVVAISAIAAFAPETMRTAIKNIFNP